MSDGTGFIKTSFVGADILADSIGLFIVSLATYHNCSCYRIRHRDPHHHVLNVNEVRFGKSCRNIAEANLLLLTCTCTDMHTG